MNSQQSVNHRETQLRIERETLEELYEDVIEEIEIEKKILKEIEERIEREFLTCDN